MKKLSVIIAIVCSFITLFVAGCTDGQNSNPADSGGTSASVTSVTVQNLDVHINVVNHLEDNTSSDSSIGSGSESSAEDSTSDSGSTSTVDQYPPLGNNLKSVLSIIRKSVVEVYATNETSRSSGSGVVIAVAEKDDTTISYIATCHHVISSAKSVSITTVDGNVYPAQFIGSDPDSDLCVMMVEAKLSPATIYSGSADSIDVGESVVAIGNPLGILGGSVTSGIISATNRNTTVNGSSMTLLQTDAAVNSGNSGGGLFTQTGYLIGIVNAKINDSYFNSVEGLGFAIPSDTVIDITTSLMETYTGETLGYIRGKYNLGFSVRDYYQGMWSQKAFVYVTALDESGCFYKAGVSVNDRIDSVTYNGETYIVTNSNDLINYFNSYKFDIGDTLVLNVTRNENPYPITVTILQYIFGQS
ncbi:MAG: trypsin-like peptidase domain-containing protein [Clostridia bacterium]|nr:trypsin-like peptidase domain-containing protein [Clostridia bacterium]